MGVADCTAIWTSVGRRGVELELDSESEGVKGWVEEEEGEDVFDAGVAAWLETKRVA